VRAAILSQPIQSTVRVLHDGHGGAAVHAIEVVQHDEGLSGLGEPKDRTIVVCSAIGRNAIKVSVRRDDEAANRVGAVRAIKVVQYGEPSRGRQLENNAIVIPALSRPIKIPVGGLGEGTIWIRAMTGAEQVETVDRLNRTRERKAENGTISQCPAA